MLTLFIASCQKVPATPASVGFPVEVKGNFTYSNDFAVETYYTEQAVALNDMRGFVLRDKLWELPIDGQVLGYLKIDRDNNKGEYDIKLPVKPQGTFTTWTTTAKRIKEYRYIQRLILPI